MSDEMSFDHALDRVIDYLSPEFDDYEDRTPKERRNHIWLAVRALMRHRRTDPAWLKSPAGQDWLANAGLEELCEQQRRLLQPIASPSQDDEAYALLEAACRRGA